MTPGGRGFFRPSVPFRNTILPERKWPCSKEIVPGLAENLKREGLGRTQLGADRKISILLEAAGRETRSTLRYIPVGHQRFGDHEFLVKLENPLPGVKSDGDRGRFHFPDQALPADRPTMFFFLVAPSVILMRLKGVSSEHSVGHEPKGYCADRFRYGQTLTISREAAYNYARGSPLNLIKIF